MKTDFFDMVVYGGQVVTVASGGRPKRGHEMAEVGVIEGGAVAIGGGVIARVGTPEEVEKGIGGGTTIIDAGGMVICPGLVDPHTHLLFGGNRAHEFEMRIGGATYMEIMKAGGGILNTMEATRAATVEELAGYAVPRLDRMLRQGTTTVEVKSGYGLDTESELKMLAAIDLLNETHPVEIVPTFMGAHAVPPGYKHEGGADDYVALVVGEMLPAVAERYADALPFCDVFCERGVFDIDQTRRVLERARELGMMLKLHVDEFESLGGVPLAVELGATSVEHLVSTPPGHVSMLAGSDVVAVSLPGTPFGLGSTHFTPARAIIDAGGVLALATDCNPGPAYNESMALIQAIACRYMKLTPAEALSASTVNAAWAIGAGCRVGSLEAGRQADLLIVDAPDYRHISYQFGTNLVQTVIKRGEVVIDGRRGRGR